MKINAMIAVASACCNSRTASVVVSKCIWSSQANSWISYQQVMPKSFSSLDEAKIFGDGLRAIGYSVTVRPNYNEDGFFREWRSFNGGEFQEVRWDIPGAGQDDSLTLPA